MANARLKLARVQSRKRRRSDAEPTDQPSTEVPAQVSLENAQNCGQEEPDTRAHAPHDGPAAALVARKRAIEARLSELSLGKPLARLEERGYDANGVRLQRTQRDFLLQEMEWMAADFAQERKWRVKTSRTLSLSVQSHHSKKASRSARQEKLEEEARRRVAARIGREVKKFWTKIDKIITFKVKLQSDELRKAAMDRHLKSLVTQTERYASALAVAFCEPVDVSEEEHDDEEHLEEKQPALVDEEDSKDDLQDQSDSDFEQVDEEEDDETTIAAEESSHITSRAEQDDELATLQLEGEMSIDELRAKYALTDAAVAVHGDDKPIVRATSDDSDFELDSADDTVDDEETIDADEKMTAREDVEDEVARLQEESEMSIDELRARYAAAVDVELEPEDEDVTMTEPRRAEQSGDDDEDDYHPPDGEEVDDESTLEVAEKEEFTKDEVDEEVALLQQESELSIEELRAKYAEMQSDDEAGSSSDQEVHHGGPHSDSDFQQNGTDEEDDETTIAEAEDSERQTKDEVDQELAALEEERTMSVDELRARYYGTTQDESDGEGQDSEVMDTTDKEEHVENGEMEKFEGAGEGDGSEYGYDVSTYKRPYLLTSRLELREYQQAGVNWLTSMCEKRINGILADEMGLGKTIQTITMLAHLACARGVWGPHLIVVPTSCMVNWEMEFKRWCPAFKVLTYFGSAKRRKELRHGWSKQNAFQVCITSYQLVVQDAHCFKRKKWYYLILDEAHNIKNWKSLRWQTLLHFNSQRRLLLTGTPLQNNIMELWSLMHFLMPHVFASRKEFTYWFQNPLSVMVEESSGKSALGADPSGSGVDTMAAEQQQLVSQLHGIIRPFVLRRLKKDVAKQLPGKFEHVISCSLSKRQRFLYEDFISRSSTRRALFGSGKRGGGSGNFMSMMNVLMQLRKVCNHPDLFEPRPIESPLDMEPLTLKIPARCGYIFDWLEHQVFAWWPTFQNLPNKELGGAEKSTTKRARELLHFYDDVSLSESLPSECSLSTKQLSSSKPDVLKRLLHLAEARHSYWTQRRQHHRESIRTHAHIHEPMLGEDLIRACTMPVFISHAMEVHEKRATRDILTRSEALCQMVQDPEGRIDAMSPVIRKAVCVVPKARARPLFIDYGGNGFSADTRDSGRLSRKVRLSDYVDSQLIPVATRCTSAYYDSFKRTQLFFPDKRLIQFDCGKLQQLDLLLRELKRGKHRCLIFTQMSSMLNILEIFLNLHGYTYFRLDGSTKVETRQYLMEKFNHDDKIFCFILSTRSGGLGINLTGADSVIFYDSDWNPAMDAQAQDRAHRIGQTRDVHIYRLVSEHTVEENILKKAQQKRHLDFLVMAKGEFTTEFFSKASLRELMGDLNDKGDDVDEAGQSRVEELDDGDDEDAVDDEEVTLDTIENAMAQLEDEDDIVAMRGAREEFLTEQREFDEDAASAPAHAAPTDKRRISNAGTEMSRASSPGLDDAVDDDVINADTEDRESAGMIEESSAASIAGGEGSTAMPVDNVDATIETDEARSVEDDTSVIDDDGDDDGTAVGSDDNEDDTENSDIEDDSDEDMSDEEVKPRRRKATKPAYGSKRGRATSGSGEGASKRQRTVADMAVAHAAQEKKKLERAKEKARELEEERKLQAWKDSVSSLQNFEDSLNAVDRYALHFREDVDPLFAYIPTAEAYGRLDDEAQLLNIEEIEAQKMIEEQQWIADGELITGVATIDELSASEVDMHYQLYKKERSSVLASRRQRQLTGEAWELKKCAITGQPFYFNTDTREATWDKPTVWVKNEQCDVARELGFSGLPTNVLLLIFSKLRSYPDRLNGVELVCRSWRDAALHPSLSVRVNASDFFHLHGDPGRKNHFNELLDSVQKGDTLLFGSGVYEIHDQVEITKPIRLMAAHDAHVELQMATPQAQLKWTARGGLICGFHISRRHSTTLSGGDPKNNWQHLLHVTQRGCVRAVFNDFDGNHQGNACLAVSGDPLSLLVLQHNRIFHSGSGSGIIVLQGALVMQRNSVFQNAHSGVTVLSGNAVVRRNQIFSNKRFGIRLLYHANNIVVEENKVENHPCGNIDVENSGRRFVVRWNEMLKDEVDDLPHNHGQVRLWTSRVEERVVKVDKPTKPVKRRPKQVLTTTVTPQTATLVKPAAVATVGALRSDVGVAALSKALAVAFAPPVGGVSSTTFASSKLVVGAHTVSDGVLPLTAAPRSTNPTSPSKSSEATFPGATSASDTNVDTTPTISSTAAPDVKPKPSVPATPVSAPDIGTTVPLPASVIVKNEPVVTISTTTQVDQNQTTLASEAPDPDEKTSAKMIEPLPASATPKSELSLGVVATPPTSLTVGLTGDSAPAPVKLRRKRKPKTEKVLVHGVELVFKDTCEKKGDKKFKKPRRANGEGATTSKVKPETAPSTSTPTPPTPTTTTALDLARPTNVPMAPEDPTTQLHTTRPHLETPGTVPPAGDKVVGPPTAK